MKEEEKGGKSGEKSLKVSIQGDEEKEREEGRVEKNGLPG